MLRLVLPAASSAGDFTYVLSSHTLADDFSVLVDEDIGSGFSGVDSTGCHLHEWLLLEHLS